MGLELIVDPSASGELPHKTVTVMLWSMGDDPALLDAKVFTSSADLPHGSENISVRWSKKLKADLTLSGLIAACLDLDAPSPG
jgi:hypothetical protein